MKRFIRLLPALILLPFFLTGCIKDEQPDCPEETVTVTVTPKNVLLSYEAHTPATQKLTVTCLNSEDLPDDTYPWTLSMPHVADSWLMLTLDPAGLTGKGTSVSGTGSQFVYIVAQENTTDAIRVMELLLDKDTTVAVVVTQELMPLQITPAHINLSGTPHHPASQTVSVSSNVQWTLTSSQPWLRLSLHANGDGSTQTINSERSRTVYLVAEGNSESIRTAEIYLNGIAEDVRVTVNQESLIEEPGQAAPRIFISGTGEDQMLMLTQNPTNYGAYFQFGSVIGWDWGGNLASYNPTAISGLNSWNSLWNNGNKDVVHTHAELSQGRGDPCRLVGYTVAEIQAAVASGRAPDNSHWRLPTNTENIVYGGPFSEWTTISGISGRVFTGANEINGSFLPAAGRIIAESAAYGQRGSMGFYVSSSIDKDSAAPFILFFSTQTVEPSDYRDGQSQGYSVRCVRQ